MATTFGEKGTTLETKTIRESSVSRKPDKTESQPVKEATGNGGIRKEYLNDANVCRVTFTLPKEAINGSESICIVGDFNNWDSTKDPMTETKNGDYTAILDLETGKEYQFRYIIDETRWENGWNADRYVKSCYGDCDNSVGVT